MLNVPQLITKERLDTNMGCSPIMHNLPRTDLPASSSQLKAMETVTPFLTSSLR